MQPHCTDPDTGAAPPDVPETPAQPPPRPGFADLPLRARFPLAVLALLCAAAVWLPLMHVFYAPAVADFFAPSGVPPRARALVRYHLRLWREPDSRREALARMRGHNAEWDFMARTFLVCALANMAMREPAFEAEALDVIDTIIEETLRLEREHGMYHFLMPYARLGPFLQEPARSTFLDGEIALMLGVRRVLRERDDYREPLLERVEQIVTRMEEAPAMVTESYPNECWMFCNTAALAAVRVADYLEGSDHSDFFRRWLDNAREKLLDPETGLLISVCTLSGLHCEGPEGTTIWMAAHCLKLIDPEFAADQYARARRELGRTLLGFGYAREWPGSWQGPPDVDSGPVVPVLGASPGASGLAFLGAATFGDVDYLQALLTSLEFAAFPVRGRGELRYCASNAVGDAVLLYAALQGPVWERVGEGGAP